MSAALGLPIRPDRQPLLLLRQNLLNLLGVAGEVVDQVVPHPRLVLVLLVAVPRVVRDGERAAGLDHERDRRLGDLHRRQRRLGGGFELLVGDAVGDDWVFVLS